MYGWTTAQIKERAKNSFRSFGYWMPVLVMFILSLLPLANIQDDFSALFSALAGGVVFLIISVVGWIIPPQVIPEANGGGYVSVGASPLLGIIIVLSVTAMILLAAFALCPILVGKNRYFMEHRGYCAELGRIFWAFDCGHYLNVAKIMFLMSLKIFLWSLLFIIPGIIKSYEYFAVPYILAENPEMSPLDAITQSKRMMHGHKFDLFVLYLSFIAWIFLVYITLGIAAIYVGPYMELTVANFYKSLSGGYTNTYQGTATETASSDSGAFYEE